MCRDWGRAKQATEASCAWLLHSARWAYSTAQHSDRDSSSTKAAACVPLSQRCQRQGDGLAAGLCAAHPQAHVLHRDVLV
jgi:uncharacterized membrane protein